MFKQLLVLTFLGFILTACDAVKVNFNQQHSEIWWIAAQTRTCYGVIERQCLMVKKQADEQWHNFYDQIEDFNYQPGYEYRLRIAVTPIDNPMADGSDRRYTLLDILEKTSAE